MRKLAAFRKLSSPFVGDKPLDSISLCFYGDSTGIKMWNNPNDPMPIKTTNMAGLQKWEETEDYIIYLCKDATMTVVENYVTGTFQEFQERKAQIEANQELMKSYLIEWTEQDSIDLINEINNKALMSLALKPATLDLEETPNEIQVLSSRTVPVTYECCFRMDKKTGEIYIGEGYENLFDVNVAGHDRHYSYSKSKDGYYTINKKTSDDAWFGADLSSSAQPSTEYTFSFKSINRVNFQVIVHNRLFISTINKEVYNTDVWYHTTNTSKSDSSDFVKGHSCYVSVSAMKAGETFKGYYQITKTSTPKPFVKSVMPSGKLDRITNANETTHTFLNKGDGVVTFGNGYFSLKGEKIQQLLVYKALLTEQEKQAELAKDIKLR